MHVISSDTGGLAAIDEAIALGGVMACRNAPSAGAETIEHCISDPAQ